MSIAKADIALCAVMVASLVVLHAMGERAFVAGLFAAPPLVVPIFFALSLCQAFLHGIASARNSMRGATGETPGTVFRSELGPRFRNWLVLWSVYVVALEGYLYLVAGGGHLIVSVPCAAMALVMVPSCFIWSPRCKTSWTLVVLTIVTPPIAFLLAYIPAFAFVYFIGPRGYMNLGLAIVPPLIASVVLVVAVIVTWIRRKRKGDTWFQG